MFSKVINKGKFSSHRESTDAWQSFWVLHVPCTGASGPIPRKCSINIQHIPHSETYLWRLAATLTLTSFGFISATFFLYFLARLKHYFSKELLQKTLPFQFNHSNLESRAASPPTMCTFECAGN